MNQDFKKALYGILGKPCWNVKPGLGSFLTLEFGKPRLVVREPTPARKRLSPKVRDLLTRRQVDVHGEWHLWVYHCDWEVRRWGKVVADSSAKLLIRRAANLLNGQRLIRFSILPDSVQSVFAFDLGARLTTYPYDKKSEQWMIFNPAQKVLSLRADGRYKYVRSDLAANDRAWKPL